MMNSLYFGLCLLAIIVIIHWCVLNDGQGQNDGSKGVLAMRPTRLPPKSKPLKRDKRSFRRDV
jgi:hypothetical protein